MIRLKICRRHWTCSTVFCRIGTENKVYTDYTSPSLLKLFSVVTQNNPENNNPDITGPTIYGSTSLVPRALIVSASILSVQFVYMASEEAPAAKRSKITHDGRLDGKVVFVTAAAQGIGRASALVSFKYIMQRLKQTI